MGIRGGSTSLPAPPSRDTPTSQAAATTAEPMIRRDWHALASGKARIPTQKPTQASVEDTARTMVTMRMSDIGVSFSRNRSLLRCRAQQCPQRHQGSDGNVLVIHQLF